MSRTSPLHQSHQKLGAKFAEFGGWEMPLEYVDGGVVAEHAAVRERVGVFDVSHLGTALVQGAGAIKALNDVFTNDLAKISSGQAQYTMLLNDEGGVVDDLIVYRIDDDKALLIPNAANAGRVLSALRQAVPSQIEILDFHDELAIIAVQGPNAPTVLEALGLPAQIDYFCFRTVALASGELMYVARTGYTGEVGYEIVLPSKEVVELWDKLMKVVGDHDGLPAGLGARDTLRTEMGYALHGHEISELIDPLQARLGWAIGWNKPTFHGKVSLEKLRGEPTDSTARAGATVGASRGAGRRIAGLRTKQRAVLRRDMKVFALESPEASGNATEQSGGGATGQSGGGATEQIGEVTSGTFSPTLQTGIALALLDPKVAHGDVVVVDVRGRRVECEVSTLPLVKRDPKAPLVKQLTT